LGEFRRHIRDWLFIWDPVKAESNLQVHDGVSFEEACDVFFDPLYQMEEESSVEDKQSRLLTGYSRKNRMLFVVAKELDEGVWRIISARKLTQEERYRHEEQNDSY
jgi:hypothetical protein